MVPDLRDNTIKRINIESECSNGLMEEYIKEKLWDIIFKEKVHTIGLMEDNMMENG